MSEPDGTCSQRREFTLDEREAWQAHVAEGTARSAKAIGAIAAIAGVVAPRARGHVPCPNCGSELHYWRGRNRVWVACKTIDCVLIEVEPDPKKPWPASAEVKGRDHA